MLPSINFLKREQENKLTEKNKTYKVILERCGKRIKEVNKSTNCTFTSFEVPKYILGFGEYNYKDCIKYIMENLINEGYNTEYFEPNHIYIDWGNASKNIGESKKKKKLTKID